MACDNKMLGNKDGILVDEKYRSVFMKMSPDQYNIFVNLFNLTKVDGKNSVHDISIFDELKDKIRIQLDDGSFWNDIGSLSANENMLLYYDLLDKYIISTPVWNTKEAVVWFYMYDKIDKLIGEWMSPKRLPKVQNSSFYVFLYLMKNEANGYYKIGITKNLARREKTLQSEEPDITLFRYRKCKDRKEASFIEKILHTLFIDYRVRGEWFSLDKEQVVYILNIMD